jgi:hypothetical protein
MVRFLSSVRLFISAFSCIVEEGFAWFLGVGDGTHEIMASRSVVGDWSTSSCEVVEVGHSGVLAAQRSKNFQQLQRKVPYTQDSNMESQHRAFVRWAAANQQLSRGLDGRHVI